ncbi:MAG: Hpt domain-containing protein, partial [Pseudomonadales bacterium]
ETAIRSRLLASNDKFRPIVEKFVARMGEQVQAFEAAWDEKDYGRLADLAPWLKGSGGSVGFDQFSSVAAELEVQAKASNEVHCAELITEIRDKYERIDLSDAPAGEQSSAAPPQARSPAPAAVLRSTLPVSNPKFCTIVRKFAERLEEQMLALESAINAREYNQAADLAHWLKGSAGSVGFAAFTEPAAELEQAAKRCDEEAMLEQFAIVQNLHSRLEVPEMPSQSADVKRA